jgi:hypothetical protein
MACFSLPWLEQICIYVVIVMAIVSVIKLLLPYIGIPIIAQIIGIILWAFVAILVIYIVFGLLSCLMGGGGMGSLMPPRH